VTLLLAALVARADDASRAWEALHDGRLVEAVDATPGVAASYYEEALLELPAEDPLRGPTLLSLARLRWEIGDEEGARRALRDAARFSGTRLAAEGLLARIDMEARRVRALPLRVGFEGGTGGFVRAGEGVDRGALEIHPEGRDAVLAWNTTVRPGDPDRIALALDPSLSLRRVALRVRADGADAVLRLRVLDGVGGVWGEAEVDVTPEAWALVEIDAPRGPRASARIVELADLTPLPPPDSGRNVLLIDDLELEAWP
jgi:hypothetical protein